jgi:hypothetical protein
MLRDRAPMLGCHLDQPRPPTDATERNSVRVLACGSLAFHALSIERARARDKLSGSQVKNRKTQPNQGAERTHKMWFGVRLISIRI